ncbi:hypothetical protein [Streptomyces sp. NPDC029526]|uniref:hypothetical protein n=1 Tax=Streptomyces sp. NPDC029526 TaxID=3155728 RepID=UPI0033F90ECE
MNRRLLSVLGAAALLVTACSGDEPGRDYSLPRQMCGIRTDTSDLRPLLPDGKSARYAQNQTTDYSYHLCRMIVDDEVALKLRILRDTGFSAEAEEAAYNDLKNYRPISMTGSVEVTSAGVADDGGKVWLPCRPLPGHPQEAVPDQPYTHLVLSIQLLSDVEGKDALARRHADIESFMRSYLPGLRKTWCVPEG